MIEQIYFLDFRYMAVSLLLEVTGIRAIPNLEFHWYIIINIRNTLLPLYFWTVIGKICEIKNLILFDIGFVWSIAV